MSEQPSPGIWQRPTVLARLCVASFINQGLMFPVYFMGIVVSAAIRNMSDTEYHQLMEASWKGLALSPDAHDQMMVFADLLHAHGVALMAVFALRTLVRSAGTLRMWQGHRDGFHIYTMAQLLGCLAPMLIAGPKLFSFLGFVLVLNWCYLYWSQRKALR